MTSLMIAYPDVQARAVSITPSASFHEERTFTNTLWGDRATVGELASNGTAVTLDYDLGLGNNSAPDYWILARADKLINGSTGSATIYYSDNGTSWTSYHAVASLASLTGPRSHDYVADISSTSSHRYWRIELNRAVSGSLRHSKSYLGTWFDMGVDPNPTGSKPPITAIEVQGGSGSRQFYRGEEQPRRINLEWQGVADAKVNQFFDKIVRVKNRCPGVFLYTRTVTSLLDGETLLHCRLLTAETEGQANKTDYNIVRATFEELLG